MMRRILLTGTVATADGEVVEARKENTVKKPAANGQAGSGEQSR
jgi:hypothetical protein